MVESGPNDASASPGSPELLAPAGPRAVCELMALSSWFSSLSPADEDAVGGIVRLAAYMAVFGVMAMLDGVRAFDASPHGTLRLTYVDPDGDDIVLNARPSALHELFWAEADLWATGEEAEE